MAAILPVVLVAASCTTPRPSPARGPLGFLRTGFTTANEIGERLGAPTVFEEGLFAAAYTAERLAAQGLSTGFERYPGAAPDGGLAPDNALFLSFGHDALGHELPLWQRYEAKLRRWTMVRLTPEGSLLTQLRRWVTTAPKPDSSSKPTNIAVSVEATLGTGQVATVRIFHRGRFMTRNLPAPDLFVDGRWAAKLWAQQPVVLRLDPGRHRLSVELDPAMLQMAVAESAGPAHLDLDLKAAEIRHLQLDLGFKGGLTLNKITCGLSDVTDVRRRDRKDAVSE